MHPFRHSASRKCNFVARRAQGLYEMASPYDLVAFSSASVEEAKVPILAARKSLCELSVEVDLFSDGTESASPATVAPLDALPQNSFAAIRELHLPLSTALHVLRASSLGALRAIALRPYPLLPTGISVTIRTLRASLGQNLRPARLDLFEGGASDWRGHAPACRARAAPRPPPRPPRPPRRRCARAWRRRGPASARSTSTRAGGHTTASASARATRGARRSSGSRSPSARGGEPIVDSGALKALTPPFAHPLRERAVSVAAIEQPDVVTQIARAFFPRLQSLSWRGSENAHPLWNRRWDDVRYDLGS
ncbi:hypothetical protein HDZ31DRAFT_62371 [Schizophyllum fasciatum]